MAGRAKTALFANEAGRGLGHVNRLAGLAAELRGRGWRTVFCGFRLDLANSGRDLPFDLILPAPAWPGLRNESWFRRSHDANKPARSFAAVLSHLGLGDAEAVASQLRAWDGLFSVTQPCLVIGDYAPGAVSAAHGRIAAISTGNGFTVPALQEGWFAPYRAETDRDEQAKLAGSIRDGFKLAGLPCDEPFPSLLGGASFPVCYRDLDPHRGRRTQALLPPDIQSLPATLQKERNWVGVYLGSETARHARVMTAIAELKARIAVFDANRSRNPPDGDTFEFRDQPFSAHEIAAGCTFFIHHGGLGITQLCAAAGVPQLIVYGDIEKWLNAGAVAAAGAGIGIDLRKADTARVLLAAQELMSAVSCQIKATEWAARLRLEQGSRLTTSIIADYAAQYAAAE